MNDGQTLRGMAPLRERLAWAGFDFANSSFTTVIVTVVFGPYFVRRIVGEEGYAGLEGDVWWGLAGAFSKALVILSAPVLGAMADRRAAKKQFLLWTWLACVLASAALAFAGPGQVLFALGFFLIANIAFASGENLVAGFLPELASGEEMGRLSGLGAAIGFGGGLASLAVALWMVKNDLLQQVPLAAAAFFFLAGLPTFLYLRERAQPKPDDPERSLVAEAFQELRRTFRERHRFRDLFRFLLALLFFQAGVEIVVAYSAIYAAEEVRMTQEEIIVLFVVLQIAAAAGAYSIGQLQDRFGSRVAVGLALLVWIAAVTCAAQSYDRTTFYAAGVLAGLGMGMSQSAARTLIGLFAPAGREGEWFGLWGFVSKCASVLGLGFYVLVYAGTGDRRMTILATLLPFLLGLILFLRVDAKRGRAAALGASPEAALSN